jgi:(S)-ureidoglycine aminohydrolase
MLIVSEADITSRCRARVNPGEYMLLPRANRVDHNLPHFDGVKAQVLATPQIGASFIEHELLVHPNGGTSEPKAENLEQFFFVLEGKLNFEIKGKNYKMVEGGFCWLPPQLDFQFFNPEDYISRVIWIRRKYEQVKGIAIPDPIIANEKDIVGEPTDTYMEQHLTPYEDLAFDMGINLQVFDPGIYFSFVESHVMEHGLYMLYGRGVYWLNGDYIEVQKDDFIYMAPWCPQFFYATGWDKSAYLLYKDVNRDYAQFI